MTRFYYGQKGAAFSVLPAWLSWVWLQRCCHSGNVLNGDDGIDHYNWFAAELNGRVHLDAISWPDLSAENSKFSLKKKEKKRISISHTIHLVFLHRSSCCPWCPYNSDVTIKVAQFDWTVCPYPPFILTKFQIAVNCLPLLPPSLAVIFHRLYLPSVSKIHRTRIPADHTGMKFNFYYSNQRRLLSLMRKSYCRYVQWIVSEWNSWFENIERKATYSPHWRILGHSCLVGNWRHSKKNKKRDQGGLIFKYFEVLNQMFFFIFPQDLSDPMKTERKEAESRPHWAGFRVSPGHGSDELQWIMVYWRNLHRVKVRSCLSLLFDSVEYAALAWHCETLVYLGWIRSDPLPPAEEAGLLIFLTQVCRIFLCVNWGA